MDNCTYITVNTFITPQAPNMSPDWGSTMRLEYVPGGYSFGHPPRFLLGIIPNDRQVHVIKMKDENNRDLGIEVGGKVTYELVTSLNTVSLDGSKPVYQ